VPTPANVRVTFDAEAVGGPSQEFEGVVGDWSIAEADGHRGLRVDGSRWRQGTPSVSLADQARRLYGERYAEFLDGVRAFAFFPLAVYRGAVWSGNYRMSVRFYPQAGRIDQAAGIAFAIAQDGSYLGARANGLEDNLLYFRVVRGRRTILDTIRGVTTSSRAWHMLSVTIQGRHMVVELDGVRRHERDLDAPPVGRVGLWSKADSQVLFDDFEVQRLP
jgi:pyruvate,water dikinase